MKIILRNIIIGIICFLGMMLGIAITINTIRLIFYYPSTFSSLFKSSFIPVLIVYLITIPSLFIAPKLFRILFLILSIGLTWFIYNLWGFIFYLLINIFVDLGSFLNLLIFIIIGTVTTIYAQINDRHPAFDEIHLQCYKLKKGEKINIVHLTDLHLGACYDENYVKFLIDKIISYKKEKDINIDFVVITGDLIDGNIKLTKEMIEPFKLITSPIYYVSGNHEDYTWKEEAFQLIENNSNIIHIPNNVINLKNKLNIIGVDYNLYSSKSINQITDLISNIDNDLPNILLYHSPLIRPNELKNFNIFLLLCGHLHGGQMFPFTIMKYFLPKKFVIEGLYKGDENIMDNIDNDNEHYLYCCAGTGSGGPIGKVFVRPKIGIITIDGIN